MGEANTGARKTTRSKGGRLLRVKQEMSMTLIHRPGGGAGGFWVCAGQSSQILKDDFIMINAQKPMAKNVVIRFQRYGIDSLISG